MTRSEITEKYQLSAERFTWELYDAGWRERFGHCGKSVSALDIANAFVGWCDASRLLVRPRSDEYAVMCEVDGEKFWFHHMPYMVDWVIDELKRQDESK